MDVLFLGTAAAEGLPAPYCSCETCTSARRNGGRDMRLRSSVLIDRVIRIDQSPDTVAQAQRLGLVFDQVHTLLVTHTHEDHLYPDDMLLLVPPFSKTYRRQLLVLGPGGVAETLLRSAIHSLFASALEVRPLRPFVSLNLPDGYSLTPLLANHAPERTCLNYIVTDHKGTNLLYAADTGYWQPETFEFLKRSGWRLDAVIMEATRGRLEGDAVHLSLNGLLRTRQALLSYGNITERTPYYATHFSHSGGMLHADLEEALAPHNVTPAYDGLCITVNKTKSL